MGEMNLLTLLEGSKPELGATQTILLPEAYTELRVGDKALIELDGALIGRATVKDVVVKCFARLAGEFVYPAIHPGMTTLASAYETLKGGLEEFSQVDPVTLITARIDVLAAGVPA